MHEINLKFSNVFNSVSLLPSSSKYHPQWGLGSAGQVAARARPGRGRQRRRGCWAHAALARGRGDAAGAQWTRTQVALFLSVALMLSPSS